MRMSCWRNRQVKLSRAAGTGARTAMIKGPGGALRLSRGFLSVEERGVIRRNMRMVLPTVKKS
ncbi:hypothetical protein D3Z50_12155 [Clostridiaceae bacterium]|nr:hypothetical protein [Clostridiaceae bacterium]